MPQIDPRGRLDYIHDIGATHASSGFEKVKATISAPFDEFHMCYPTHQPKRADDLPAQSLQDLLILRSTKKCLGSEHSASVIHIQWRTPILMGLGKDNLAIDDN